MQSSLAGARKHPGIFLGQGRASSRMSCAAGHQTDPSTLLYLKKCVSHGCLNTSYTFCRVMSNTQKGQPGSASCVLLQDLFSTVLVQASVPSQIHKLVA